MKNPKQIPCARALLCAVLLALPALAADDPPSPSNPAAASTQAIPDNSTNSPEPAASAGSASSNGDSEPSQTFRFFKSGRRWGHREGGGGSDMVSVGEKATLDAADSCPNFVVVLGSADCRGHVYRDAVLVSSDAEINGTIDGDLVLILSHAHLGPKTVVNGQLVVIGPAPEIEPGAKIAYRGTELTSPVVLGAADYVTKGLIWGRPFPPQVDWVWGVAFAMFAMTFLVTLLFPRPVSNCVATLRARPFACFFAGIGLRVLALLVAVLAACTVILIPAIPFLICIVFCAALLGKAAISVALGQLLIGRGDQTGSPRLLLGFVVGAVLIYILYMIPLLGLFVFLLVFPTVLGAGVLSRFGMPRSRPLPPSAARPQTPPSPTPHPPATPSSPSPAPAMTTAPSGGPAFPPEPVSAPPASWTTGAEGTVAAKAVPDPFLAAPGSTLAILHTSVPGAEEPPVQPAVPPPVPEPPPNPAPFQPTVPTSSAASGPHAAASPGLRFSGSSASSSPPPLPPPRYGQPPPRFEGPPPVVGMLSLPRAGFFWRLAATGLDLVLICAAIHFLVRDDWREFGGERTFLAVWLAYHVGMWMWKGTTLGGSVFGLRLARTSGAALDWPVAFMRAFASCLSFLALGLGFFWVAWDPEKQSWHDKIADTVIVKLPRAIPLV